MRGLKLEGLDSYTEYSQVAPHDGCVDWNTDKEEELNGIIMLQPIHDGCVDWNTDKEVAENEMVVSHPTMGAWIEIPKD